MRVVEGHSFQRDPVAAVAEATEGWGSLGGEPDVLFAFLSASHDPAGVAAALAARYPSAKIVGCTTAGEHLTGAHHNESVVLAGAKTPEIRWAVRAARDVCVFDAAAAQMLSDQLLSDLGLERDAVDPSRHFCVMFVDGLERKEELVASLMADALEGMPLVGGSAGDDLRFESTQVLCGRDAPRGCGLRWASRRRRSRSSTPALRRVADPARHHPRRRAGAPRLRDGRLSGARGVRAGAGAAAGGGRRDDVHEPPTFVCDGEIPCDPSSGWSLTARSSSLRIEEGMVRRSVATRTWATSSRDSSPRLRGAGGAIVLGVQLHPARAGGRQGRYSRRLARDPVRLRQARDRLRHLRRAAPRPPHQPDAGGLAPHAEPGRERFSDERAVWRRPSNVAVLKRKVYDLYNGDGPRSSSSRRRTAARKRTAKAS